VADTTAIEWADATLNIITGCTKISDGCTHCYIERTPPFRIHNRRFDQPGIGGSTGLILHPDRLTLPLRWRKPRRIFVNSLSDLFHDDVPDGLIAALWLVMGQSAGCIPEQYRGHVFQVLTKRPARMRSFVRRWADVGDPTIPPMDMAATRCGRAELVEAAAEFIGPMSYDWMDGPRYWPAALPGVWLGVSAENQQWAGIRIPALLDTPAVVRWISAEPLLGPIDLTLIPRPSAQQPQLVWDVLGRRYGVPELWQAPLSHGLDWVVTGGESGPSRRPPADPDWFRQIRDQCTTAGVAYLHKQNGGITSKAGGRLLDGRTWDEYPEVTHA
jgi:protein gp37